MEKIAIGGDHAGYALKEQLKTWLTKNGYPFKDFGPYDATSVDYPDFAHPVSLSVESKESDLGVLICGSANGVAITANKHQGVRAAICWLEELAALAKQHNNANVLCLPARYISPEDAEKILNRFLTSSFEGGRHATRVNKISC